MPSSLHSDHDNQSCNDRECIHSDHDDDNVPFLKYLKPKRISKSSSSMHRKNKYLVKPPNFVQLAEKYPFFAKYINSDGQVDWSNAESMVNLTRVLLKDDYQIEWRLPLNHLCPPVTNRVNYVHWINDLLEINGGSLGKTGSNIIGIDVGTGASCIYPLLGCRIYGWKFIGTDICEESLGIAKENIELNEEFQNQICLVKIDKDSGDILKTIIPSLKENYGKTLEWVQSINAVQFTMCNPPFFDIDEEIKRNPNNDCRGNENEMVTEGGEEAFVKTMMNDSMYLIKQQETFEIFKNCWFTSMLGKKRSLQTLKEHISNLNNTMKLYDGLPLKDMKLTFHTTEFIQGQTTRWGFAWKFETPEQTQAKININLKVSSIAVQKDMFQNIHKGYNHAGLLLSSIQNCLLRHKELATISKVDTFKAIIMGYLAKDKKQNFEITIMQTQPKKFTVKTSYKGSSVEDSLAFSQLYETLSKEIFSKCV